MTVRDMGTQHNRRQTMKLAKELVTIPMAATTTG
jgi:hypothetical protein